MIKKVNHQVFGNGPDEVWECGRFQSKTMLLCNVLEKTKPCIDIRAQGQHHLKWNPSKRPIVVMVQHGCVQQVPVGQQNSPAQRCKTDAIVFPTRQFSALRLDGLDNTAPWANADEVPNRKRPTKQDVQVRGEITDWCGEGNGPCCCHKAERRRSLGEPALPHAKQKQRNRQQDQHPDHLAQAKREMRT